MVSTAVRGSLGLQFDDSNLQPGASFLDHRFAEAPPRPNVEPRISEFKGRAKGLRQPT